MGRSALRTLPPSVVDGALALALTAATQVELSVAEVVEGSAWAQRLAFLVMTAAVAGRRVAPLAAALVCAAGLAVQTPLGTAGVVGGFLASMIVTHAVALRCERGRALGGLVALLVGVHLYDVLFWAETSVADLVGNAAIYLAIWGLGRGARHWRSQAAELRARVEAAVREQEERAAEAVRAERARVARELHDVVAHGISMMTLQAGAARRVLDGRPPSAHGALLAVEEHGRRSLEDMQRLLGVLRRGARAPAVEPGIAPEPQGADGDLEDLVVRTRTSGLPVELTAEGDPHELPGSLAPSVHRIVQEALTNALRHGPRQRVVVHVRYGPDAVEVEVVDRGDGEEDVGSGSGGSGLGLLGMAERASALGGELHAGPTAQGWRVLARLPRAEVGGGAAPPRDATVSGLS